MRILLILFILVIGVYLLTILPLFAYRFVQGKMLARDSAPFSIEREGGRRILVVGDSSAVGVGVTNPRFSTAGLLAQDFSGAIVINLSKNGSKLRDVAEQVKKSEGNFDLILIQAGGNNVIYFDNLEKAREEARELVTEATSRSNRVVMLSTGNLGLAPIFPFPLNRIMTERTRTMRAMLIEETASHGVAYVDLFEEAKDDPFKDASKFYSADRLHLSNDGYAYWYSQIRDTMNGAFPDFK